MEKFKKGDKFIPHKPKENAENQGWLIYMDKYEGKTLAVAKISGDGWLMDEVTEWFYNPDWCEKVGDSEIPNDHIPDVGKTIDWEQRRYELAKEFMTPLLIGLKTSETGFIPIAVCTAIIAADEMIKQLKAE